MPDPLGSGEWQDIETLTGRSQTAGAPIIVAIRHSYPTFARIVRPDYAIRASVRIRTLAGACLIALTIIECNWLGEFYSWKEWLESKWAFCGQRNSFILHYLVHMTFLSRRLFNRIVYYSGAHLVGYYTKTHMRFLDDMFFASVCAPCTLGLRHKIKHPDGVKPRGIDIPARLKTPKGWRIFAAITTADRLRNVYVAALFITVIFVMSSVFPVPTNHNLIEWRQISLFAISAIASIWIVKTLRAAYCTIAFSISRPVRTSI